LRKSSICIVVGVFATSLAGCSQTSTTPIPQHTTGPTVSAYSCYNAAASTGKTWYVSASAASGGTGTKTAPFSTLAAVQTASGPGDTIVILASPVSSTPLDGGIALQQGQRLVGNGPTVLTAGAAPMQGSLPLVGSSSASSLPVVTNSTTANNGDAIELANNASVYNVVVKGATRGGIYGSNVTGVCVQGNDVSATNTSKTVGFQVLPFYLESYTAGQANHVSLNTGWASIMVDESTGTASVTIDGNYVHGGICSDGIDLRSMGTAVETAQENGNFVTGLVQCSAVNAVQAFSTQANVNGSLNVTLYGNTQENNGSSGADTEALFVNEGGSGQLVENVSYNYYNTGIGGASTNGLEFIVGDGTDETGNVTVTNSTFINNPGDMIEMFNRGTGSQTKLTLTNDTVQSTTISGGLPSYADPAGQATTPDNTGECIGVGSVGAGNTSTLVLQGTVLESCGNDGIAITNNHPTAQGAGSPALVSVDLENSTIMNVKYYGLWMNTVTPLQTLSIKAQDTAFLTSSSGVLLGFDDQSTGGTTTSAIDLGGGSLGSTGGNCFLGGDLLTLEATGYNVSANSDWWGAASGPASGTVQIQPTGFTASTATPLASAPAYCSSPG
jgi:hypothetical protein